MPRRNVDELLIAHLASGKTIRETARLVGCGEATVRRRLADPAFRQAVQQAKREMVEMIRGDLRKAAMLAVATLEALLTSDEPSIRLRAAEAILSHFRALHPEAGAEPEEAQAGGKQVKIVYEIVDCTSDGSGQDVLDDPPDDRPQRIEWPGG
jgi:predicted transcriptional regulator